jgi:RNA polymerase sigma-70 factor (ECF subfamily)
VKGGINAVTDEEIIEMLFERSEKSIEEIDKKYGRKCRNIAMRILGDERDAEECVNDAYLGVWNAVPPERPKPFSTFLYRILRNTAINKKRAKGRQKRTCVYFEALEELAETLASSETVESALESKELQNIIRQFLLSLAEEEVVQALEVGGALSLDTMATEGEKENNKSLYALLASDDSSYEQFETKEALKAVINELSDTERALVKYRYVDELSQSETAKKLGVSQMFISRMERKVLAKLKENLKGEF